MNDSQVRIPNKKTINSDPQYFGAYFNMARHNIFMLINHLTHTFPDLKCIKLNDDENIIDDSHFLAKIFDITQKDIIYEYRWRVFNYLNQRHHLSILKFFKKKFDEQLNPSQEVFFKEIHDFLKIALNEISSFRNSYTHYLSIDDSGKLIERKTEVDGKLKDEIDLLFKEAPNFSFIRHESIHSIEDFTHLRNYKLFEDNTNRLTPEGIFFFTCLFLERQHAIKFLKKFTGFKNETSQPFKATIKAFTAYTIKLPNEKIVNENPKQSLLMEILNELNKCPKELYYHLTDKDKKEFEPDLGESEKMGITLNSLNYELLNDEDIEKEIRELSSLKRHQDRFPYFALRYLDEMDVLKDIRFQITLGKLTIRKYSKNIVGQMQDRIINKTINAFGKLSDFKNEEKVLQMLKETYNNSDEIFFEQFAPHYNINNNKIGIYLFQDNHPDKIKFPKLYANDNSNQPTAFLSINDLPKFLLLDLLVVKIDGSTRQGQAERLIKDFINTTNKKIFDKTLLEEIKSKVKYEPEKLIREILDLTKQLNEKKLKEEKQKRLDYDNFIKARRSTVQTILSEHKLVANQLPSKVLDYLMNIQEPNHSKIIHNQIRQIQLEIKDLLYHLDKQLENKHKPKLGELATFLARDMINMVIEKDCKEKITSPYFNKLQNMIAFYSQNKHSIVELCNELNLFDKEKGHVFLTKELIMDPKNEGIIDFYRSYLTTKKKWITIKLHIQRKGYYLPTTIKLPFLFQKYKKRRNGVDLDNWKQNKLNTPINLPASLFDELLNKKLLEKLKGNIQLNEKVSGISNLLRLYFNNDTQPFYGYNRRYIIKTKSEKGNIENEVIFSPIGMSSKELNKKYGSYVESNEKLIRFTQTKDRICRLMCEGIIKDDKSLGLNEGFILLNNIHPNSDCNPLDTPVTFTKLLFDGNYKIVAKDADNWKEKVESWKQLSKDEKGNNLTNKTWYSWTIKDFGRFNKLLHDRRLPKLLKYFDSKEIPFSLIEFEINEYNIYREKIFDEIFNIEKAIIERDNAGLVAIAFTDKKINEVQFENYIKWLKDNDIIFDEPFIKTVRNRFSHSEFPEIDFTGLSKIPKEKIVEFEQRNHEKGYKGSNKEQQENSETYISISRKIYDKYNEKTSSIVNEIKSKK